MSKFTRKTLAQPARMRKIFNYTAGCKVFVSRRTHRLRVRMPRDLSRAKRRWAL